MLTVEERMEIAVLKKHGQSIRVIAKATGVSRNTVRRYLREGPEAATRKTPAKRAEKLDPYKGYIVERLHAATPDQIPAAVLFREIKARGYTGGETRVKQFVRAVARLPSLIPWFGSRPRQVSRCRLTGRRSGAGRIGCRSSLRRSAGAGRPMSSFATTNNSRRCLAVTRTRSRLLGGVPREGLYDNMKTVVLERNAYSRNLHCFHPGFLDYAKHAGFLPRLCRPYRAKTKGKVERFIRYLKGSFWVPFSASCRQAGLKPDKHAANAAVSIWLREIANARVHATTGEVPAERLVIEHGRLQDVPKPYLGRTLRARADNKTPRPVVGHQHPLAVYDALLAEYAA